MASSHSHSHSHYPSLPGNPEHHHHNHHLYASWTSPYSLPQASGVSSTGLHREAPSAQPQLPANYLYHSVGYVSAQPTQPSLHQTHHYRRGCIEPLLQDCSSAPLPDHHGSVETGSSVPQSAPVYALDHAAEHGRHEHDGHDGHHQHHQHHFQYSTLTVAPPTAPPLPTSTQSSAPVARLLNYPLPTTVDIHGQPQHLVSPTTMAWPANPSSAVAPGPAQAQDFSMSNMGIALSPGMVMVPSPTSTTGSSWSFVSGLPSASVTPVFGPLPDSDSEYTFVHAPTESGVSTTEVARHAPLHPAGRAGRPTANTAKVARGNRRAVSKQKKSIVPSSYTERQEKSTVSRRRGPLTHEKREKAAKMRKGDRRNCIRCKMYKVGCDQGDPCDKCVKSGKNPRLFLQQCCRDHIDVTSLFRRCNGRFNQSEADYLRYPWNDGGSIQYGEMTWNLPGFGPLPTNRRLGFWYRYYYPEHVPINSTESEWHTTDGRLVRMHQRACAVYDTAALQEEVEAFVGSLFPTIEQYILERNRQDEIAWYTYKEATRLRDRGGPFGELLDSALRLQCLSVMSQGYGTILSDNVSEFFEYDFNGTGPSEYEAYNRGSHEKPLPVAMGHQMDVAFIKYLQRCELEHKKALNKAIYKSGKKPWYELFLTFFILLWNMEYIHSGAEAYIKAKSGTKIASQVGNFSVVAQQMSKWDHSFRVLMSHWQAVLRRYEPFNVARDNPEELRNKGVLPDAEAFNYMMRIVSILDRKGPDRFQPPCTGFTTSTRNRMGSNWIAELIQSAGG